VATPREVVPQIGRQDAYMPAPGRPPPSPPTVVSVEHVETPKPITASVDKPLKLDEESKNTKPEEVSEERKEKTEAPLRLEEELEETDKGVEEMKIGQGLRGRGGCL
jgi:hypothetical protein